jgi:hypothetical protein
MVLCGEIYGAVQDLRYGAKDGEFNFRAFDLWDAAGWRSPHGELPEDCCVPLLGEVEYDLEQLKAWAELDSAFGGIREGLVIQPLAERTDPHLGRVKLKLVSNRYLSR